MVGSERRNPANGRIYIVVVTADDGRGGVTTQVCVAAVCPHDQNQASLETVLAEAAAARSTVESALANAEALPPVGFYEHGLSAPLGPKQ